jgi:hypothetical protein
VGGAISDRFVAQLVDATHYHIIFASDGENGTFPGLPAIPPGAVNVGNFVENGSLQLITTVVTGRTDADTFSIESNPLDVAPVPEPAAVILLFTLLALVVALRKHRVRGLRPLP